MRIGVGAVGTDFVLEVLALGELAEDLLYSDLVGHGMRKDDGRLGGHYVDARDATCDARVVACRFPNLWVARCLQGMGDVEARIDGGGRGAVLPEPKRAGRPRARYDGEVRVDANASVAVRRTEEAWDSTLSGRPALLVRENTLSPSSLFQPPP